jgi:CheY-like chemotaxis protein
MSTSSIIAIEDSDTDFLAFQHALKAVGVTNPIERCEDGLKAAGFLLSEADSLAERASLVVLDLNLPGVDGRDLLRKMRAQDPDRRVPIIVLSTSSHPGDIDNCYRSGADAYMVKPLDLEDWETKVGPLAQSWLEVTETPRDRAPAPKSRRGVIAFGDPLTRVIECEIIPRLLLAHDFAGDGNVALCEEEVSEIARLLLTEDFTVAEAYLTSLRAKGVTAGSLYMSLLAPAAKRLGDWWRDDSCTFTEVSMALSRLQRLMRVLGPMRGPTKH